MFGASGLLDRITRAGGTVQVDSAGAVQITPLAGQGVTVTSTGALAVSFNGGTDANTTLTVGQGGVATAARNTSVVINAPSQGAAANIGNAYVNLRRNFSDVWFFGIDATGASGAKTANTDLYFHNGSSYVASLTTAGAFKTASSITVQANGIAVTGDSTITGGLRTTANSTIGGSAAVAYAALFLQRTLTVSGASSLYTNSTLTPAGNGQSVYNGQFLDDISAGTRTSVLAYGVQIGGTFSVGSGSFASITGLQVAPTWAASAAGAATNTGIDVGAVSGGTSFNYGLRVRAPTGTGATGIRVDGGGIDVVGLSAASAQNVAVQTAGVDTITGAVGDAYTGGIRISPNIQAATAQTVTRLNYIDVNTPTLGGAGPAAVTNACVFRFDAAAGTHKALDAATTKTTPGGVDAWRKDNVNGTIYYSPMYLSKTA